MKDNNTKFFDALSPLEFDCGLSNFRLLTTPLEGFVKFSVNIFESSTGISLVSRRTTGDVIEQHKFPNDAYAIKLPGFDRYSIEQYMKHPESPRNSLSTCNQKEILWELPKLAEFQVLILDKQSLSSLITPLEQASIFDPNNRLLRISIQENQISMLTREFNQFKISVTQLSGVQYDNHLNSLALKALMTLVNISDKSPVSFNTKQRINCKAIEFICENYDKPIAVAEIANYCSTTTRNLQIVFKEYYGCAPMFALRSYRLRKLAYHLNEFDTITDAASYVGLKHMGRLNSHFETLFSMRLKEFHRILRIRKRPWLPY